VARREQARQVLPPAASALLSTQDGVASRAQLLAARVDDNAIEVAVRRRELTRIARGVYVDHTGEPSWQQRVWAACLRFSPAVADPATTLSLEGIAERPSRIGVAVDAGRFVGGEKEVRVLRTRDFAEQARLDLHPPRLRLEAATVAHAGGLRDEQALVGFLSDVVGSRRTTAARLLERVAATRRLPRRHLVHAVLTDLEDGMCSNLERIYTHRVERAHGLPAASRQVRTRAGDRVTFRDNEYLDGLLVVELDGRVGHDTSADRWADAERDLHTTLHGGHTLRLVWQQALDSCRAAVVVGSLLGAVGWTGRPTPCGVDCLVT
jgi:hypothetical protein